MPFFNSKLAVVSLTLLALAGCATPQPKVPEQFQNEWEFKTVKGNVALIESAPEAIARRIDLVRNAKARIDIEYFSWNKDTTGLLFLNELLLAADRGVKVRIILDDLLVFNETWLASAATHNNLDIQIFNAFNTRKAGWLTRAFDFQKHQKSLDHRLHEKYMNIDGETLILGGRNIGDDYFSYKPKNNFFDLDILVQGDVAEDFERNFTEHWIASYTSDIEYLIDTKDKQPLASFKRTFENITKKKQDVIADIETRVSALQEPNYVAAKLTPIFDSAEKLDDSMPYFRHRIEHFVYRYPSAKQKLVISTPYMLPNEDGFKVVDDFVNHGADITLVTNSMASNDSGFVPAYYQKHREELLDKGVNIYEYDTHAIHLKNVNTRKGHYHNKAFILDNQLSYIGSSNFDPRSDFLNLEFGVMIESEEFARQLEHYLLGDKSLYWKVEKNSQGKLEWTRGNQLKTKDPNYSGSSKVFDKLYRAINIENEL
ncbi:phospholipase D-like domain-containing protein [Vibrio variabilis]|uniref:phospholipase D-like domain-containing protein n=1 Tax=Vibrio variabilis TaxID=990271 RepID=UPI000DD96E93|nr:phospholipase D family protein [Vibrio variabilis]